MVKKSIISTFSTENTLQKYVNCRVRVEFDLNPTLVRVLLQNAVHPKDIAHGSRFVVFCLDYTWFAHIIQEELIDPGTIVD